MANKKLENTLRILEIFGVLLIAYIMFVSLFNNNCCTCGIIDNDCCPCPNKIWFDNVEAWAGHPASSSGSWLYMCEEYQRANNVTFNCFE